MLRSDRVLTRALVGLMLCSLAQVVLARDHGPCFASSGRQGHACSRSGQ